MFELRELDDDNNNNNNNNQDNVVHELDQSYELKIIFKQIFHWISLWNSSMGRDLIYNIESLENGISVIDHILTPKDEELWPIFVDENNCDSNNRNLSAREREEESERMQQERLGGVMQVMNRNGVVNVQPEGFRNFETLNNGSSVLLSPPHNNATQPQAASGTSSAGSTNTTTTTSTSALSSPAALQVSPGALCVGSKRDTSNNMQVTQPTSPLDSPLPSPISMHSTSFSLPSASHYHLLHCSNGSAGSSNSSSTSGAADTADPNWQAGKSTVRERNAAMFNNELMADVQFVVGSDPDIQKIPAHKYVLATGSSVFYAMFYGGLAEDKEEIEVPDVEPAAFLTLLKYLYCDEIQLEADNVLATLYVAKKYIVPHLARACVNYLETSLTAKNACLLLSQSRLFEEPDLMQRCWEVIDAQAEMAIKSEGFVDIDLKTFETILNRETLNCKEINLFEAALNWAQAACAKMELEPTTENKRQALGSALYLIRIPTMTLEEFANRVAQLGILTQAETIDIFLNFTAKTKPNLCFPVRPRAGLKTQVCHRFQSCAYRSNQWRYRGRCDSIQFSVDKRIFIIGFGLYGSSTGAADYNVKIELKRLGRILAENNTKFFSDGSSNTFHVFFEHPIQIEPESFYTASVILDGSELSFFGQEGMTEVCMGSVTFQFQCSSESTNGTGVQGGQIPELIFYGPSLSNGETNNGSGNNSTSNTLTRRHTMSGTSTGNNETATATTSSSLSGLNHRTENNIGSGNSSGNKADD